MNPQEPKGKEEKTMACGGFERMFEMMRQRCEDGGSLPDCFTLMSIMEKCCGPRMENRGEGEKGRAQ